MLRKLSALLSAPLLLLALAGCSDPDTTTAESEIAITQDTVILDVRTPQEYDEGHLEGARLLDFNSGEVAAAIPQLDPDSEYLVYCRSGNRSAQAIQLMEDAGFEDVTNLGSLEEAAEATTLPIVN